MAPAPPAGRGFFPLDEALQVGAGTWSPAVEQALIRLGTWMPFERVPRELAALVGVTLGCETVRRRTEAAGRRLVAAETAAVEQLGRMWPSPPAVEAGWYQVSVDGAMVPLVHKEWAEVKTLAIGLLDQRLQADGTWQVQARALSYFSRLTDADTFRRLAWVETHRRGLTLAPQVCAVGDGAAWCQRFYDWHCPAAVRILDWAHAAGYVVAAAQATFGAGTVRATTWLTTTLEQLLTGTPGGVFAALRTLPVAAAAQPDQARAQVAESLAYLEARAAQIRYATFRAAGYPIGSGIVESANKLVVEARLKGSGMHWARANVNPMVALRAAVCSDRWAGAWDQIAQQEQAERVQARATRAAARRAAAAVPAPPPPAMAEPTPRAPRAPRPRAIVEGRPTAAHPWRRDSIRRQAS
jgi:hypothetical protein